ncbi:MAG: cytochrome c3 family protein [Desulfobacterales bacterium]|nr:cytochrome c3 family protein [Desulfobacterales bacterium]
MSTTEEKEKTVAEGEQETAEHAAAPEQLEPVTWRFLIPIVLFGVGFVVSLFIGWVIFPKIIYCEKHQPIDFSHSVHQEAVDEGCESCHFFREDGSFSGIPKLENCAECHEEAMGENPEEAKLIEKYVEPGKEIPWLTYASQPDCVFFSHAAHIKMAELECAACHGRIGDSDHTRPYQCNILTGYSRDIWGWNIAGMGKNAWDWMKMDDSARMKMDRPARMKMDDCGDCHEKRGTSNACFVCHK